LPTYFHVSKNTHQKKIITLTCINCVLVKLLFGYEKPPALTLIVGWGRFVI